MLGKTVVLGLCDVAGAGVQVLASLKPPEDEQCRWDAVHLEGFEDPARAFVGNCIPSAAIGMRHWGLGKGGKPEVTCIMANTQVPAAGSAAFVHALVEFILGEAGGGNLSLVVVGSMRIRESMTTQGPYVVSLCGATIPAPWNDLEVLPPTCKVAEPLLAALFHFLTALRVPATCVIAAGFKPGRLQDVSTSTLPVVSQLGPVVARGLSCAFAAEAPGGLEASAAWHGTADDALDGSVMFL